MLYTTYETSVYKKYKRVIAVYDVYVLTNIKNNQNWMIILNYYWTNMPINKIEKKNI